VNHTIHTDTSSFAGALTAFVREEELSIDDQQLIYRTARDFHFSCHLPSLALVLIDLSTSLAISGGAAIQEIFGW